MVSVTQRIKKIKQPYGGYLPVKNFKHTQFSIEKELNSKESIHASLIGIVVDYLTRFMIGDSVEEAFKISLIGASHLNNKELKKAKVLLNNIQGLDDVSIKNACKLVGYDSVFRAGRHTYKPVETFIVDEATIENIYIMVKRSLKFIETYGPVELSGFTIGPDSRTKLITSGDGDFLTKNTLWDFKVTKNRPTKNHTLQLLIYYLMGNRSSHIKEYFTDLKYIGIYNPRLQSVYEFAISDISPDIIEIVKREVIGY